MFIVEEIITLLGTKLEALYGEPLLWVTMLVFLSIATYTDIKSLKISNRLNLAFLAARLLLIPLVGLHWLDLGGSLLAGLALLIPAMVLMHKMGGDIKIAFVLGLYLGAVIVPLFLLIACGLFAATALISGWFGKKIILLPFAPFFLASHVILLVGTWLLA